MAMTIQCANCKKKVRINLGNEYGTCTQRCRNWAIKKGLPKLPKEAKTMSTPIMKYFEYQHLPEKLQSVSKPIGELAKYMNENIPDGAEKSAGLRKLLEAKDCLVRAALS